MNKLIYGVFTAGALCAASLVATALPAVARDRGDASFTISLGNVQFGYSDGYYDNDRRWHDWNNDAERDWYRQNHGQSYYHMNRLNDRDQYRRDWREGRRSDWRGGGNSDFSALLSNVVFGYSDGYYDNNRRWHRWQNSNHRNWYLQNHRASYFDMRRYRDRDQQRRDWLSGRRADWRFDGRDRGDADFSVLLGNVMFGYSDGYYDNNRRWNRWQNSNHRNWYLQNHRASYFDMRRYRDRDRYRRDWLSGRRADWRFDGRDRGDADFSVLLGNVVFGYSDGYYDNDRRWHVWQDNSHRNWYLLNRRASYYDMRRDGDRDQYRRDWLSGRRADWRSDRRDRDEVDFSVSLANVVFGYSDGYYDNVRAWHGWQNDDERNWYERNHRGTFFQMGRNEDSHRNRRDWREGRSNDWRGGDRDRD